MHFVFSFIFSASFYKENYKYLQLNILSICDSNWRNIIHSHSRNLYFPWFLRVTKRAALSWLCMYVSGVFSNGLISIVYHNQCLQLPPRWRRCAAGTQWQPRPEDTQMHATHRDCIINTLIIICRSFFKVTHELLCIIILNIH